MTASAISEVEQVMVVAQDAGKGRIGGPEGGSAAEAARSAAAAANGGANYADSLRLTEDDRVNVFVTYASLLSKGE